MIIIISEKAIAGESIASHLADGKILHKSIANAKVMEFNWLGNEVRLIPLRGHISDVEFPKKYSVWVGLDVRELINAPVIYSETEQSIINAIKDSSPLADQIIIATDADREGESIGLEALTYAILTNPKIKISRAYFSAITKEEISKSFSSLEKFDYNFAYSANARREIDLIWGAVLTRFISIISGRIGKEFLSVGRVQTPTLALIIDREKERLAFQQKKYWEIWAHCEANAKEYSKFSAIHLEEKFWEKEKALSVFNKQPKKAVVKSIDKKVRTLKRPVPFNTTEFLRAATAIGFSAGRAMNLAETLYQKGFTSYPRTDNSVYPPSINLKEILNKLVSVHALVDDVMKVLNLKKIEPSRGKESKDHPPIYPVGVVQKDSLPADEWKIYELISRRFLATLSEDAETENVSVLLDADNEPFVARGQVILRAGWKSVYPYSKLTEVNLPKLSVGDVVKILNLELLEKETQPPARFSQGSLIKLMEENNLGTKSTRPAIIQKLFARKYISGNKSVEPSKVAFSIIDSLEKHCDVVTKPKMTSDLEKEMDEIAAGKKSQKDVVVDSGKILRELMDLMFKEKDAIGSDIRNALRFSEVISKCDKCPDGQLVVRRGKSGKRFVGCSSYPACNNSFPLPQKGIVFPTPDKCPECNAPIIRVRNGRFFYKMCLTMTCVTKKDWGKPKAPAEKKELQPAPQEQKESPQPSDDEKKIVSSSTQNNSLQPKPVIVSQKPKDSSSSVQRKPLTKKEPKKKSSKKK